MRIVLLGMPAAGKGTQARLIAHRYGIAHISTGEMFREEIEAQTALGREAKKHIDQGRLVPDAIAVAVVKQRVQQPDCLRGFVLDGFPRTLAQAKALDQVLTELRTCLDAVLNIEIDEEEVVRRISGRLICEDCGATYQEAADLTHCTVCGGKLGRRSDDTEETARKRLAVYYEQTLPLVKYYTTQQKLYNIEGQQEVEMVFAEISKVLNDLKRCNECC
ncbi:MAG TPA: adenylate kinase [Firmicutes bacterium]|nr:adenylate kinase [Bacillota bacterium]